jgi:hypothetical protein
VYVERIELPANITGGAIRPTLELLGTDGSWVSRPWGTKMGDADGKLIGTACLAAIPIVIFFFFDQNVSSLLCQIPEMNLSKGTLSTHTLHRTPYCTPSHSITLHYPPPDLL